MAEKVKIKTKYGTISATPEQAEAFKAREEQDRIQKERIAAVRENARTMNRYREQKQTYKDQTGARERRAAGGYDATPTNRYGQPIESFWAKEPPAMPEMRPVPALPEVPQLPIPTVSEKLTPRNIEFYERVQDEMQPKYSFDIETGYMSPRPLRSGPFSGYSTKEGYQPNYYPIDYAYNSRDLDWNMRQSMMGSPLSERGTNWQPIYQQRAYGNLPVFPYYPRVI
jgi:hypothetical protein